MDKDFFSINNANSILDNYYNNKQQNVFIPIKTGFIKLDQILSGGIRNGLYVLGAVASSGKTTLLNQIADNIAIQKIPVIFISYEMSSIELICKSLSRISFFDKNTNSLTSLDCEEKDIPYSIKEKYYSFAKNIFIIEGNNTLTILEINKMIKNFINEYNKKPVVIIDYLQLLSSFENRISDKQNMDFVICELKKISKTYNIPIITISSLNRNNYNSSINLQAFKESGSIEYSSDYLMGIERIKDDNCSNEKRKINFQIIKNRKGKTDSFQLYYFPKYNTFSETDIHCNNTIQENTANWIIDE